MLLSGTLARLSLFQNVGEEILDTLATEVALVEYRKGGVVPDRLGDRDDILFVFSGEVTSIVTSKEGREVAVEVFAEHAVIGEFCPSSRPRRETSMRAESDCLIGRVPSATFRTWITDHPIIARNLLSMLSRRLSHSTERIFDLVVRDVDQRVRLLVISLAQEADALIDGGEIEGTPSHTRIASLVGANREAVSRVFSRLNRENIVRSERQRIYIKSVEGLTRGLETGNPI